MGLVYSSTIQPDDLQSKEELIATQYRVQKQSIYSLPKDSVKINLVAELQTLVSTVSDQTININIAIKKFDALLGLNSSNVRSFFEEFCSGEKNDLAGVVSHCLSVIAGAIAKSPFNESDDISQENNGGILAAARFLTPYIYVVNDDNQTLFMPEGDLFYAFQGSPFNNSLAKCEEQDTVCLGNNIYFAIKEQLTRLLSPEQVTVFLDNERDVRYGATFKIDQSTESEGITSEIELAPQTIDEQITNLQLVWEDLTSQFRGRVFVNWEINKAYLKSTEDVIPLEIHNANTLEPTFTSLMVYENKPIPLTVTIADVYGNAQIYYTALTVENTINEIPVPIIDVKQNVEAGEQVTAILTEIRDNPDDTEHDVRWEVYQGSEVIATGRDHQITFQAPELPEGTTLRVKVIVDDRHEDNNIGTKEVAVTVSGKKETALFSQAKGMLEKTNLARVFGEEVVEIPPDQAQTVFPDKLIEAITLDDPVNYYDLTFLVDSSGSMHEKLAYIKPRITDIIAGLKNQVTDDGFIRIHFYTYGNEQTHPIGTSSWISIENLVNSNFESGLDQTITFVSDHNLDTETAWYSVWDLYEGKNSKPWQAPIDSEGDYEHRMVILSDEEVDSPENVTRVLNSSKPFDRLEALAFVSRHPDTSLEIIELSSEMEYAKWYRDQLRAGEIDVVAYNPADNNRCPEGMSYIPGRRFPRGGSERDEQPWSVVTVDPYCMAQTEMTNAQYQEIMEPIEGYYITQEGEVVRELNENVIRLRNSEGEEVPLTVDTTPSPQDFDAPLQPVVNVTWYHARLACDRIGGRLPTEAEWENAAKSPDGSFMFSTSDGSKPNENKSNWRSDTIDTEGTSVVGSYPAGPFGLSDISGNVWEWTSDYYANSYNDQALDNPTGPDSGNSRVVRGGSWYNDFQRYLRSANRDYVYPDYDYDNLGFRCASAPQGLQEKK